MSTDPGQLWDSIVRGLSESSAAELVAVLLAIVYLLLAVRENIWCWAAAFVSTLIFLYVFYDARLYMESALQLYYLAMAVYGWHHWRHGSGERGGLAISVWPLKWHLLAIVGVALATGASGSVLATHSDAAYPYLDSFTTWAAVLTTFMVARKVLENWIYWFVIDSLSMYLYIGRGLLFTAALFFVYLIIVVFGFRQWLQSYRSRTPEHSARVLETS